jgi:hypothetical protein
MTELFEYNKKDGESWKFNNLHFCAAGRSTDKSELRAHMKYLKVENGFCMGLDGKRLHVAPAPSELTTGWYNVIKNTKTMLQLVKLEDENASFPDMSDIMGTDFKSDEWEFINAGNIELIHTTIALTIRAMPLIKNPQTGIMEPQALNFHYLENVLSCDSDDYFDTYIHRGEAEPLIMVSGDKKAFIMPMRI